MTTDAHWRQRLDEDFDLVVRVAPGHVLRSLVQAADPRTPELRRELRRRRARQRRMSR